MNLIKNRGKNIIKKDSKKLMILGSLVLVFLLSSPIIYNNYYVPYHDKNLYKSIKHDVENLLENKYTGAIKESISSNDLNKINNKIKKIHSKNLRSSLNDETKNILDQVAIQTYSEDQLNKMESYKKFENINIDEINKLISNAGQVKNVKLRSEILRKGNLILDRYKNTKSVIDEVNKLKPGNWALYYNAEANVKTVYYKEVKNDLKNKLSKIKSENENLDSQNKKNKEEKLNNDIKNASTVSYDDSVIKGSSTIVEEQVDDSDSILKKYFANNNVKYIILLNNQKIGIYKKTNSNGIYSTIFAEDNFSKNLSVTETTNISIVTGSSVNSSSTTQPSLNSDEIVKISTMVLGTDEYADVKVSKYFLDQVKTILKNNNMGVAFLAK